MNISGVIRDRNISVRVAAPSNMPFLITLFVFSPEGHRLNSVIRGVVPPEGVFLHQQTLPFRALDMGFSSIASGDDCQAGDSDGDQPSTVAFELDGPFAERRVPRGPVSFGGQ